MFLFGFLFYALHEMHFTALPLYKKESSKRGSVDDGDDEETNEEDVLAMSE